MSTKQVTSTDNHPGIKELKGFVYHGRKDNNQYNRTTKAIADYCGSKMTSGIWELIMKGEESDFPMPKEPKGKATEYSKVCFSREVDQCLRDRKEYTTDKARAFAIIRGQCVELFRSVLEGHDDY